MSQSVLPVILLSHFIAALVALGMPPFFGLILTDTFAVEHTLWVGWFYVIPTVCTAVAAPFWGRMADRFGRRWSLLRAQVGLSVAFIVAGLAPDVITFAVALMAQGFLGGTFAASSAYLSTVARGQNLAESLNWMQGSARSAMILAPILLGFFITRVPAQHLYLYMAILPLISALLVWKLAPRDPVLGRPDDQKHAREKASASAGWLRLRLLYFGFNFALVASFPYFIPWTQARTGMTAAMAGVLYSLPHALYLLILVSPLRRSQCFGKPWGLPVGLALFALSYVIQATAGTTSTVLAGRWIMGLGMTTCLFALNAETASLTRMENAGQSFGVLDSAGKWAGVAAGVLAGVATGMSSQTAPFWLGAGVTLLTITLSVYRPNRSHH
ncbi:Vibrioferrin membrane-spanning transport protein PvsC [Marinobacter nitratireducens]|uniref:Vibrioferrin membrane-spanning transport protein PvsC n=1 Tax=Marinobacter nitratireducens TaxID=1137280 RepID=A0A072MXM9_9GAMM|nr:MFS transporter [Marinobacter nitratireducens]KEF30154.1 Vibrioferrin membrane-spanning transport protein PvsC [Marinobacter nitratireducens]